MLLSKMDMYTKSFLRQNRRPNIQNKISAAETESRIVKLFCFGRIFRLSVDHCKVIRKNSQLAQENQDLTEEFYESVDITKEKDQHLLELAYENNENDVVLDEVIRETLMRKSMGSPDHFHFSNKAPL